MLMKRASGNTEPARSGPSPRLDTQSHRKVGVIHQPYFLPWLGYFSKLCFCDVFVVLDRVHFTKRHLLDRTRITNMHGQIAWLSLPTGQNLATPIAEVRLRPPDNKATSRLIRTIEVSYATALRFEPEWPFVEKLLGSNLGGDPPLLLSLNVNLLSGLLAHVGISPPRIVMASSVTQVEGTTTRFVEICERLGITNLVIGTAQSHVVHDLDKLRALGVKIFVQDYLRLHPVYSRGVSPIFS